MDEHIYEIKINNIGTSLCVIAKFDVDTNVSELLKEPLNAKLENQISEKSESMHNAALYMMRLIKYSLNLQTIEENLIEVDSLFISADNENWNEISSQVNLVVGPSYSPRVLTNGTAQVLQEYVKINLNRLLR